MYITVHVFKHKLLSPLSLSLSLSHSLFHTSTTFCLLMYYNYTVFIMSVYLSVCLSVVLASPSCRCSQVAAYCCQPAHCCVPDEGEAHSWPLSHVQGQNGERPAHWRRWGSGWSHQRGRSERERERERERGDNNLCLNTCTVMYMC